MIDKSRHGLGPSARRRPDHRIIRLAPPHVLALSLAALSVAGMALLLLPGMTTEAAGVGWLEALFTAVSAVTVTGLAVADTGTAYTGFGQAVILVLIQVGGLGIMVFAALTIIAAGGRLGLGHRLNLGESLGVTAVGDVIDMALRISRMTLLIEAGGAVLLTAWWTPRLGLADALWFGVFHSVSAFNNAGFALWPESLTPFAGDVVTNGVVMALIVLGGIGFPVLHELASRAPVRRWSPHARVMLWGSLALIALGWAAIALLEWGNPATLGALADPGEKALAALFQSVTTRTAGFNTIDMGSLGTATAFVMMVLMFIGAGPTSTAGGIKVSTAVIMLAATTAFLRRRDEVVLADRSLPLDTVGRALAIAVVGVGTVAVGTFALVLAEPGADFLDACFEVVSAHATVGLSRGLTGEVGTAGRVVLIALMFAGRLGPLALGYALLTPRPTRIGHPRADLLTG